ncbi:AAA family ATPase [Pasteurella atlantica]|uniref:ATP-dependent nuclease n=1 Tax=Pasteurellaceae TaxID=712 RepID=UPI0027588B79|nr:AAA family ATPase [Pasteurella atlantica]MDP8034477.1 AAA family ATPase [Pasteurella atlantica]MDP8036409.1 AAA family ATPase [Pasteurella atlantica]MDP8038362.1 AAA family ATPase [Pasteurella atlantica]MDP8048734.1 AAA family ATPase [Pasteurella atlantica]MDP8050691.1 AAA family ATPase [Pasteurella atlantica]
MKLKKLIIKNFRNFEDCSIDLSNKNLIFGMNDVGKSNLIYALRVLFEQKIRNTNLQVTDFHKQNTNNNIEISCLFDISDDSEYSQLLIAKAESASISDDKLFKISLLAEWNNGEPIIDLQWGTETEPMINIPSRGVSRSLLDDIFHCIFIPSQNNINSSFKNFKKELLSTHEATSSDKQILKSISNANQDINTEISTLSSVQKMEEGINEVLSLFDQDYQVKISPNHTFGDLHNNLELYMRDNNSSDVYPTSGDGRVRKVMYALINYLLQNGKDSQRKIPILLIEEPENHLFLSAQIELSKTIFSEEFSLFLFLTTHSPQLFFRISDDANLIRLHKENNDISTKSEYLIVPDEYKKSKNILLENLAQCLFVDKVLLVEGESEKLLFEWVLDSLGKDRQRILIQPILGVHFEKYVKILVGLGIKVLIKTDNDIKRNRKSKNSDVITYSPIGYNRCINILNIISDNPIEKIDSDEKEPEELRHYIRKCYSNEIKILKNKGIYLSEVDLENDLADSLELSNKNKFIEWLQEKKWQNMWSFINLNHNEIKEEIYTELKLINDSGNDIAQKIYDSEAFICLKALNNEV